MLPAFGHFHASPEQQKYLFSKESAVPGMNLRMILTHLRVFCEDGTGLYKALFPAAKILPFAQLKYTFRRHFLYCAFHGKALHQPVELFLCQIKHLTGSSRPVVPSVLYPFIQ